MKIDKKFSHSNDKKSPQKNPNKIGKEKIIIKKQKTTELNLNFFLY